MNYRKLPSGNWQVREFVTKIGNKNQEIYATGATKKEARQKLELKKSFGDYSRMTVTSACEKYLEIKRPVLAPSTHRGYMGTFRTHIENTQIGNTKLSSLTQARIQTWVSGMAKDLAPKSVKNNYSFLTAVLSFFLSEDVCRKITGKTRLPQKKRVQLHTPTTEEINLLLANADPDMQRAILLGATAMMRRGEISALTAEDLDRENCTVSITKAMSSSDDGGYITKLPKTDSSYRTVRINPEIMSLLPEKGPVVDLPPHKITRRFRSLIKATGVEPFRFHDLRHYGASIAASSAIGAGTLTIQGRGGWETDHVLKRTYEHSIEAQEKKDTKKILKFFSKNLAIPTKNVP